MSSINSLQLQVNLAGAWKTILHFDAGDDSVSLQVQRAAQMLHEVSPGTKWRIATHDAPPLVLYHMGNNTGGLWVGRAHDNLEG